MGSTSPAWFVLRCDLAVSRSLGSEATISETASPAPRRLHIWRNGRSVTPAIGATTKLLSRWCEPMYTVGVCSEEGANYTEFAPWCSARSSADTNFFCSVAFSALQTALH